MRARGFTLIEVLVALAILALTAAAVTRQSTQVIRDLNQLESRTRAFWIADDEMSRVLVRESWPPMGVSSRRVEALDREWEVRVEVSGTPNPDMRRIEVSVASAAREDLPLVVLTGFGGRY